MNWELLFGRFYLGGHGMWNPSPVWFEMYAAMGRGTLCHGRGRISTLVILLRPWQE